VVGTWGEDAGRARRAKAFMGHLAVDGECPLSVAAALDEVFAQKDHHWNAISLIDGEAVADIRVLVSIEKPQSQTRTFFNKAGQNRALQYAVSAPRARKAEQVHLAFKPTEQHPLAVGERYPFVDCLPPIPVRGRGITGQKVIVWERLRVESLPVHLFSLLGYNHSEMNEVGRLLVDLQRAVSAEQSVALGISLKDDAPLFAVLLVRGNQIIDVLATGRTPEEACRLAVETFALPVLR